MVQKQEELQYETGADGQLHAVLSNTAQLAWRETVATSVEAGNEKRNVAEVARVTLNQILPKQLLIDFKKWFDPNIKDEAATDVNEKLVGEQSAKIGRSPWYMVLILKLRQLADSNPKMRRDEVNPFRANNTMGILINSAGVFMDQDKMLARRMLKEDLNPETTSLKLGEKAEEWIGEDKYSLLVDNIFKLMELVKEKKIIGQANQIVKDKIKAFVEAQDPVPNWLEAELDKTGQGMLMPEEPVRRIYKIGELCLFFLGRDDNNIAGEMPEEFKKNLIAECTKPIKLLIDG